MKTIKSHVTYKVPHWNFCNVDRFDMDATPSKQLCQFCIKTKAGYRCALYDESLASKEGVVAKTQGCCRATAAYASVIEPPALPTINPRDLIKQTIDMYSKTVNELVNQGYPRAMAENAAKQHLLSNR